MRQSRHGTWLDTSGHFLRGLNHNLKYWVLRGHDLVALVAAAFAAAYLPPRTLLSEEATVVLFWVAPVWVMAWLWTLGQYRTVVRSANSHGPFAIAAVSVLTGGAIEAIGHYVPTAAVPPIALVRFCFFLLVFVGGGRLLARDLLNRAQRGADGVVIYGAGEAGRRLAETLASSRWRVVAFLDDEPQLQGRTVRGLRIASPAKLSGLIERYAVRQVLLAMPSISRKRRSEILKHLVEYGVAVRTVPDLTHIISGAARVDEVLEVDVADILWRDSVPPIPSLMDACVRGRIVLVTGAGGSIGSELCRQIIRRGPRKLILLELAEHALYQIERDLQQISRAENLCVDVVPLLGNARHRPRMRQIMRSFKINSVYHAAAYKHVPMVEQNVIEGVHNNVLSTLYLAEAAVASGVEFFLLVSTDKAVNPTNVMGATKRLAELILQGMQQRTSTTRFCMVRFGNVLGSSGSVVPLFHEQIRSGGPVTVTHPDMRRFFMSIPEAVNLILQAGSMGKGGDVFVLDMGDPVRIADLARRMIELSGLRVRDENTPDGDIEIQYTGLRPAEKLFEELLIGKDATGTDHPRVLRAVEPCPPWGEIEVILNDLQDALGKLDCGAVLALLRRAVGEYAPTCAVVDLVSQARETAPPPTETARDNVVTQLAAHRLN
jgi:FlaA1/EpsC-like NDP-sugar epimerase